MTPHPQPYYPITEEELNLIKNDCYHPSSNSCEGCEYTSDDANPCTWKGANILMEEILTRQPCSAASGRERVLEIALWEIEYSTFEGKEALAARIEKKVRDLK